MHPTTTSARFGLSLVAAAFTVAAVGCLNALGVDLMNDPDRITRDAAVAWRTGLWFWNTQTGAGSMTPHDAITTGAGFGETIRSINGALECGGRNSAQVQARVDFYKRFTSLLGVSTGGNEGC